MTNPSPFDTAPDSEEAERLWLKPITNLVLKYQTRFRTILIDGAQDAESRISSLADNTTFSAGVKSAQLRLVMNEIQTVHKEIFGELIPVVGNGSKDAAVLAVNSFSKADKQYLAEALGSGEGGVSAFIASQKRTSQLGVANAITSLSKADLPLSGRVYRSNRLANNWIKNKVVASIARGASAQEIAKQVRSSIRPTTPGGTAYAALRLGRTELNNAFHATAIELAKDRPWVENMSWHLSQTHVIDPVRPEICERLSEQIFEIDKVPAKPHPHCRCYITPHLESFESFVTHLTAGQYRSWINEAA